MEYNMGSPTPGRLRRDHSRRIVITEECDDYLDE